MSATDQRELGTPLDDIDAVAARNPKVDAGEIRAAQDLMAQLRSEGLERPSYAIASPYEHRPLHRRALPPLTR